MVGNKVAIFSWLPEVYEPLHGQKVRTHFVMEQGDVAIQIARKNTAAACKFVRGETKSVRK